MAVCDKWVALKIVEFCVCVACLVAKRISSDDEARLALLLQKLSREWSLLTSVTWDSVGGAFADAIYGGYVIITFGLLLGRVFQEVPKGRRILEGFLLGMGMLFFLILGGLELASLDSVPHRLIVNASVLGAFSLVVAALFLLDLMGPRPYTTSTHAQTTEVTSQFHNTTTIQVIGTANGVEGNKNGQVPNGNANGHVPNGKKNGHVPNGNKNGYIPNGKPANGDVNKKKENDKKQEKPLETDLDEYTEKIKKEESILFEQPIHGYSKFEDKGNGLEKTKFGSVRNEFEDGKYVRLSDPLAEPDRLHYERELAKFNERYLRDYLDTVDTVDGRYEVKENYLPEPQTPQFAKVKTGRLKSLYDEVSPSYEQKRSSKSPTRVRTIATPTLQQLEDYLRSSSRARRGDTPALFPMEPIEEKGREAMEHELGRASGTPTDPGYVQYTADKWPDKRQIRTPRHSPTH